MSGSLSSFASAPKPHRSDFFSDGDYTEAVHQYIIIEGERERHGRAYARYGDTRPSPSVTVGLDSKSVYMPTPAVEKSYAHNKLLLLV